MFNNEALSIVIGLTFIYLLYSLLGTLIQEIIATNIQLRGLVLRYAIHVMLGDSKSKTNSVSETFYKHPFIKLLKTGNFISDCPSYIDPDTFSKVLIDLLRGSAINAGDAFKNEIQNSLTKKKLAWNDAVNIPEETISYLNTIWIDSQGDTQKFKSLIEDWFNKMMRKSTTWYKQSTQLILLVVGLVIAIAFNVDTLGIVKKLESNPTLTQHVVEQADNFVKVHPNLEEDLKNTDDAIAQMIKPQAVKDSLKAAALDQYKQTKHLKDSLVSQAKTLVTNDISKVNDLLGLGWPNDFLHFEKDANIGRIILGWLLTALAISLGAPFWYDLLNKLMQLKGAAASTKSAGSDDKDKTAVKPADRVG
ncbi:hypothetical protein [Mucilaginibacter kameinonensis]|uniref:hypothetical protein n=1 Tax=Mucilaginibacter kameinonensis TaxID=452286 RepID=UPI000EF83E17|nr:hypothetical protein [Mucilaginibacter kameinonensis]